MMKLGLLFSTLVGASLVLAGCAHQDTTPAPAVSMAPPPPPTVTSAPLPPPGPPPPSSGNLAGGNSGPGGTLASLGAPPPRHHADDSTHVYKLEFVLTPKDPKDAALTPTSFTLNVADHSTGEVMIGKNIPLGAALPPTAGTEKFPAMPGGTPRVDVGLKVKAHPQSFDTSTDVLVDVDLEMSTAETGGAIKKVVSHGSVVATPGKSGLVVSLDDDKRHWDLTVTTTKLR